MYVSGRCRCIECKKADADYQRQRRAAIAAGTKLVEHGVAASYKSGCRCAQCKGAHRVWVAEYRAARIESGEFEHGTSSGYVIFGCRCVECRAYVALPAKKSWIKRQYGLDYDDYIDMYVAQDGMCASCGDELQPGGATHIDHCHDSGAVRGLLCRNCNVALGLLKDSVERIDGLRTYLTNHIDKNA